MQMGVELPRRVEVGAEGLLNDDPPWTTSLVGHPEPTKHAHGQRVELRRGGEVVDPRRDIGRFEGVEPGRERRDVLLPAEIARLIEQEGRKPLPRLVIERPAVTVLRRRLPEARPPLLVGERRSREADDPRVGPQGP